MQNNDKLYNAISAMQEAISHLHDIDDLKISGDFNYMIPMRDHFLHVYREAQDVLGCLEGMEGYL